MRLDSQRPGLSNVCTIRPEEGQRIPQMNYLELPSIGWQLFILDSSQSDPIALPAFLDTYATRLLTEPLITTFLANFGELRKGEVRRILLPKLFGNSQWIPNRGSESGQEGSKESRSAASWRHRRVLEMPSAIFQTVSEGKFSEVRMQYLA